MKSTSPLSDDEFLAAFHDCRIAPRAFDHRGHLRIAWLLLQRHPLDEAVERTCAGIARLAAQLGAPGKYHRTLTEALVKLMAHCGAARPELGFEEFLAANPALVRDARGELARHYSAERLGSAEARARFVPPDRLPLPPCPAPRSVA